MIALGNPSDLAAFFRTAMTLFSTEIPILEQKTATPTSHQISYKTQHSFALLTVQGSV